MPTVTAGPKNYRQLLNRNVCTVTDFSSNDKASGVKFFHGGLWASWAGNLPFCGTLLRQKPKIGRIRHPPGSKVQGGKTYRNRVPIKFARRADVGSACVDIRPSLKTEVLVYIYIYIYILCFIVFLVPGATSCYGKKTYYDVVGRKIVLCRQ